MRGGTLTLTLLGLAACGGGTPPGDGPEPETAPLPTAGVAGRPVTVYPLTLIAAEEALGWREVMPPRREALQKADSVLAAFLSQRAPEVTWVFPAELRRLAGQAPGLLADPDQMGTAVLRAPGARVVPDPLRAQMRQLTGTAGDRFALVPASLVYVRVPDGAARAELTLVLADVRTGRVGWRTVAKGEGDDPWDSLWNALKPLVPGLP